MVVVVVGFALCIVSFACRTCVMSHVFVCVISVVCFFFEFSYAVIEFVSFPCSIENGGWVYIGDHTALLIVMQIEHRISF